MALPPSLLAPPPGLGGGFVKVRGVLSCGVPEPPRAQSRVLWLPSLSSSVCDF
jgi:hypothetical protein